MSYKITVNNVPKEFLEWVRGKVKDMPEIPMSEFIVSDAGKFLSVKLEADRDSIEIDQINNKMRAIIKTRSDRPVQIKIEIEKELEKLMT
ncbi:MAG: hypothetical protein QXV17_12935 [Candidatus Micrarchaeaceae archaeon]